MLGYWDGEKGNESETDAVATGSESESYQSGSMHVNESIDRGLDRCCIYNTGKGWINAYLMCKEAGMLEHKGRRWEETRGCEDGEVEAC